MQTKGLPLQALLISFVALISGLAGEASSGDVMGQVAMPAVCSPSVNPAVVWLVPLDAAIKPTQAGPAQTQLVRQKDLCFDPRVQALVLGGALKFTNNDQEAHNVHIQGAGVSFNQNMAPGAEVELKPTKPGLLRLLCDIHIHMRGYVWVSETPWIDVCNRDGKYRIVGVPPGRYEAHVWHAMGKPAQRVITVTDQGADLGVWEVESDIAATTSGNAAAPEAWPDVIDRISLACASALDVAGRRGPNAPTRAVTLVDEAYLGIFEPSDMEVAVGSLLGYDRVNEIESQFRALRREARAVASGKGSTSAMGGSIRKLLTILVQAARDLQRRGVSDRSGIASGTPRGAADLSGGVPSSQSTAEMSVSLRQSFDRVISLVEKNDRAEAATELATSYFDSFEPIERVLAATNPGAIRPLETRFALLRGQIEQGLNETELETALASLHGDVEAALAQRPAGDHATFGFAFLASFGTITREGLEILLIVTLLSAVIAKAGNPRGARFALWSGVVLAVVASGFTALGLNLIIGSARSQTRELIEGVVMLAASAVLFYVSYWLIAQSESQRWLNFLKEKATAGATAGRYFALGLAAFLAVYREGAEVVLMYQGLLSNQSRPGLFGVLAGIVAGVALLAILAVVLRFTSKRIPLKPFFQVTGVLLFVLSIVFAGHGVLELQTAQVLRATEVPWLGAGIPVLGLHPTQQGLLVQSILLAGGALAAAYYLVNRLRRPESADSHSTARPASSPTGGREARVGNGQAAKVDCDPVAASSSH